jgi:hypothetical protein
MKASNSSKNIRDEKNINSPDKSRLKIFIKNRISLQDDKIKEEIFNKLNEGTILNFIRKSIKKETSFLNSSENSSKMKYDLNMINKYEEDSNSNLSFISEFDLEEDESRKKDSFDSCFDDNSVEEIQIN